MRYLFAVLAALSIAASAEAGPIRDRFLPRGSGCTGPGCGTTLSPNQAAKPASVAPATKAAVPAAIEVVEAKKRFRPFRSRQRSGCGCK